MTLLEYAPAGTITRNGWTLALCIAMLILFAVLSYSAALTKNATFDEPLHAVSGYVIRDLGDYRIDPEDPAFFTWLSSIPHGPAALAFDREDSSFKNCLETHDLQWISSVKTLYRTPRNNADQYINASRFLFMLIGLAAGAIVCWWAWCAAGRIGAIAATAAYAMDPNFLGHASLVKNDVPLALVTVGLMFSLWRFGRRGTWANAAGIIVCLCAAMSIKFSGPIFFVIAFVALRIRAAMNQSWPVMRWELKDRAQRWVVPYLICAAGVVCSFVFIWWCYGFRYAPTPDPNLHFDFYAVAERYQSNITQIIHENDTTSHNAFAEQGNVPIPAPIHVIHFLEQLRILPEAWLHGLFYTYATTVMRGAYLNGEHSLTGWWYFFPLCVLYKTPVGMLCLLAVALVVALVVWARRERKPMDWLIVFSLAMLLIRALIWGFDVHFPVLPASMVENITHSDRFDEEFADKMAALARGDVSGRIGLAQTAFFHHQYAKAKDAVESALKIDSNNAEALKLEHQINNETHPAWFNWAFNLLMLAPLVILVAPAVLRSDSSSTAWLLVCLITPMVFYGGSAMASNFNLGIRHVLPLLPLLHLALGVAAARLLARWGQLGALLVGFLGVSLVIESCAAWPNYIAFFNAPSGGERGGIGKLSDSNLDWGQDLKLLADWHKAHPNKNIYLCYFGMADPTYYAITPRIDLPGGYDLAPKGLLPKIPGVIAISATDFQATYIYWNPQVRAYYAPLWNYEPREVLGGTIYLFDWPLKPPTTQQ